MPFGRNRQQLLVGRFSFWVQFYWHQVAGAESEWGMGKVGW